MRKSPQNVKWPIRIRKLGPKDLLGVWKLYSQLIVEDFFASDPRISLFLQKYVFNRSYFRKSLKNRSGIFLGAFKDTKLVGLLIGDDYGGGALELTFMGTNRQYRGMGVGVTLLRAIEEWALKHYFHYLFLYTEEKKNISYYKKRGFRYVGMLRKAWFGVDEYLLEKELREKPFESIFRRL